jgi:hypothetical protein
MLYYYIYCGNSDVSFSKEERINYGIRASFLRMKYTFNHNTQYFESVDDLFCKKIKLDNELWLEGDMDYYWVSEHYCLIRTDIVNEIRKKEEAVKPKRITEILSILPGMKYKCIIQLTDDYEYHIKFNQSIQKTVADFMENTKPFLSCELEFENVINDLKDNIKITAKVTSIQYAHYIKYGNSEKIGDKIVLNVDWYNIEKNENFIYSRVYLNDDDALNIDETYKVLCMPLNLFQSFNPHIYAGISNDKVKPIINIWNYLKNKEIDTELSELIKVAYNI